MFNFPNKSRNGASLEIQSKLLRVAAGYMKYKRQNRVKWKIEIWKSYVNKPASSDSPIFLRFNKTVFCHLGCMESKIVFTLFILFLSAAKNFSSATA